MDEFEKHWQGENASIPSVPRIKDRAKKLCKDAYDKKTRIATGGLEAYYEDGFLQLCFVLEEWETS